MNAHKHRRDIQIIDMYLHENNSIVDDFALVISHVPHRDLVLYTLIGLGHEYETFLITLTHIPMKLSFDYLHQCLLLHGRFLGYFMVKTLATPTMLLSPNRCQILTME